LGFYGVPQAFDLLGTLALEVAKHVRMRRISFSVIGLHHVGEFEGALFLRHPGVEHDLEQEVAELVAQIVEIAAGDGVGHFVGLFQRIGRNGREILLQIPRAAGTLACATPP